MIYAQIILCSFNNILDLISCRRSSPQWPKLLILKLRNMVGKEVALRGREIPLLRMVVTLWRGNYPATALQVSYNLEKASW